MRRAAWAANASIAGLLFLINFSLNTALFMRGDPPYRDSIEGGYAAMARFIAAHPHPWGWNPTEYCGLPTQFTYLPVLPYAAAALSHLWPGASPDYCYRLITATLVCLGPVTLFFFALYFTRSRVWALIAALAYTFFSPSYGLIHQIDKDRGGYAQLPWRLLVFAKYGEGPHNAGLTLMPLALIAVWRAAIGCQYKRLFLAAVLLAAVALTNWIAALALAFGCLLLILAAWGQVKPGEFRPGRIFAAAALAYLLACFWMTPSFIGTVLFNWPTDAFGYHFRLGQWLLAAGLVASLLALRIALRRLGCGFHLTFVTLALVLFGWIVLAYYWAGIDTIPESRRYALELELFLMLAFTEAFRRAMANQHRIVRRAAVAAGLLLILLGARQAWTYLTQDRYKRRPWPLDYTIEYPLAKWLAGHQPAGRVFASGGLRFRLNAWFDVPQIGGGFESGLRNRVPLHLAYQVRSGKGSRPGQEGRDAVLDLEALGAQYVVVHGPKSREHFRDFVFPREFGGVLPVAFHLEDDTIYELPFHSLAHLVRPDELPEVYAVRFARALDRYVAARDDPARPKLQTAWLDNNTLIVEGPLPPDMLVAVQVNHDPGWSATQDGRAVRIGKDNLGFLVLRPAPSGFARIVLRYAGTAEQRGLAVLSGLAWLGALGLLVMRSRERA